MDTPAPVLSARIDGVLIDQVANWLISRALGDDEVESIFAGCCYRLHATGVPLVRAMVAFRTLHPLFHSVVLIWKLGEDVDSNRISHTQGGQSDAWLQSPMYHMVKHQLPFLRRPLVGKHAMVDFPILESLRDEGITDYLCYTTPFTGDGNSGPNGIIGSWATDRPNGFSEQDLRIFERIQRRFAVSCKVQIQRRITLNVLETYLGPDAGGRVLDGQIQRGDGEHIRAVIWYSDMRDSTRLADCLDPHMFIERLNLYFECTAGAVLAGGGQVLRFIGDAVLAIFPIQDDGDDVRAASERAFVAARAAESKLSQTNQRLAETGEEPVEFGLGLHVGEVMYGNIGVPERLEFSVIGRAANEVARIESLTKELGRRILLSATFADAVSRHCESLGKHLLHGVGSPIEVFAPRAE